MKYQYATGKKHSYRKEVWVCDECRKANSELILIGKWRLVDRNSDPKLECQTGVASTLRRFLSFH